MTILLCLGHGDDWGSHILRTRPVDVPKAAKILPMPGFAGAMEGPNGVFCEQRRMAHHSHKWGYPCL
jgi:hypothetical protein